MHGFWTESLGPSTRPNPITIDDHRYLDDSHRIPLRPFLPSDQNHQTDYAFEIAGPRSNIFFNPSEVRAAIISCGGLCPGINAVIRALVMQLWHRYQCRKIVGGEYGYHAFKAGEPKLRELEPESLQHIHELGGSILGSSRGSPSSEEIAVCLKEQNINMLFTIGGDGTMRGAYAISEAAKAIGHKVAVIGIPKTIDNDIPYVRRSFGFETAVALACQSIMSAHTEAKGYQNGVGLVRLMGRHSGYIAASATLATGHANYCLVPEIEFEMHGPGGLIELVEQRLKRRQHCLIVAAEGAGQKYFNATNTEKDASGNLKLGNIGLFLKKDLSSQLKERLGGAAIKYIDPSYIIRAAPAIPGDQLFCARLAQDAVHAAMAGKTSTMIGYWHGVMTHVPLRAIQVGRQSIDPKGGLWFNVLESTGQPSKIGS